jgi:hypothetical protein
MQQKLDMRPLRVEGNLTPGQVVLVYPKRCCFVRFTGKIERSDHHFTKRSGDMVYTSGTLPVILDDHYVGI